jgi:hypothetical protein
MEIDPGQVVQDEAALSELYGPALERSVRRQRRARLPAFSLELFFGLKPINFRCTDRSAPLLPEFEGTRARTPPRKQRNGCRTTS